MEAEELRELEDLSIRDAVRLQEDIGLEVVTDGEYRRNTYFSHFFERIGGLEFDRHGEKGWDYTNESGGDCRRWRGCALRRASTGPTR